MGEGGFLGRGREGGEEKNKGSGKANLKV